MSRASTIKDMEERLHEIEAEKERIDTLANSYRTALEDYRSRPEETRTATSQEVTDGAFAILQEERPLRKEAIHERLLQRSVLVAGTDPASNTIAHISTDPRFTSDGKGHWTLSEDHQSRIQRLKQARNAENHTRLDPNGVRRTLQTGVVDSSVLRRES